MEKKTFREMIERYNRELAMLQRQSNTGEILPPPGTTAVPAQELPTPPAEEPAPIPPVPEEPSVPPTGPEDGGTVPTPPQEEPPCHHPCPPCDPCPPCEKPGCGCNRPPIPPEWGCKPPQMPEWGCCDPCDSRGCGKGTGQQTAESVGDEKFQQAMNIFIYRMERYHYAQMHQQQLVEGIAADLHSMPEQVKNDVLEHFKKVDSAFAARVEEEMNRRYSNNICSG